MRRKGRHVELEREVIGLIPAGGQGLRVGILPCSKEIYPIGFDQSIEKRPKAISQYLLEKMHLAGVNRAYIVLREGKWDIPSYLRHGKIAEMNLAYLIMDTPFGVPYTIDQAFAFVQEAIIAFGFPDIFFEPHDVFVRLLERLSDHHCDAVLGLFPADRPHKVDMVDIDQRGLIRDIVIKPRQTSLKFTWGVAVWSPTFTRFIHAYVKSQEPSAAQQSELFMGNVVRLAIAGGLHVEAVHVSEEPFIDIGTPDDLFRTAQKLIAVSQQKPL